MKAPDRGRPFVRAGSGRHRAAAALYKAGGIMTSTMRAGRTDVASVAGTSPRIQWPLMATGTTQEVPVGEAGSRTASSGIPVMVSVRKTHPYALYAAGASRTRAPSTALPLNPGIGIGWTDDLPLPRS